MNRIKQLTIYSIYRSKSEKTHLCGTTLLARPPKPTVLVGAAHCTFVCTSQWTNRLLPNCCCDNVAVDKCNDNPLCFSDAKIEEMTGEHAEIVCGEWQTNTDGVEDFNILLPIQTIIRHPDYQIVRGEENSQYVSADLAVFKVDDNQLRRIKQKDKVYPACLPKYDGDEQSYAVHAGWSSAPPEEFLRETLRFDDGQPAYYNHTEEFLKKWHYNMSIATCRDPEQDESENSFQYPTNSFYPKATICATDIEKKFCPTSGESGCPLMLRKSERFEATGIQSFTKGKYETS